VVIGVESLKYWRTEGEIAAEAWGASTQSSDLAVIADGDEGDYEKVREAEEEKDVGEGEIGDEHVKHDARTDD
jgi:hypothetical protein